MPERISFNGDVVARYTDGSEAMGRCSVLNSLEGNDNIQYLTAIRDGEYLVVRLYGLSDDSMVYSQFLNTPQAVS